jgi:2'-5' RNA ligase
MRCFVACFPTPQSAERLAGAVRAGWLQRGTARLIPQANYHLTLRFLGEITAAQAGLGVDAVAHLDAVRLRCRVEALGGFPRSERAKVVAAIMEPCATLTRWSNALASLPGADPENAFIPHITVARSRRPVAMSPVAGLEGLSLDLLAPALYESVSTPDGIRYANVTA